ncbi:hypothetical protein SLS62_011438, partial [Diatrype stigma]
RALGAIWGRPRGRDGEDQRAAAATERALASAVLAAAITTPWTLARRGARLLQVFFGYARGTAGGGGLAVGHSCKSRGRGGD